MTEDIKKETKELVSLMQEVVEDRSVPRNIRSVVEAAMKAIQETKEAAASLSNAIYMMDDISNDINMPSHTRTDIWEIISKIEAIKEKVK
ncbi:MAG: UPF0147 family protein [Candidatus Diapherotrites archaeon]|nr:UPF0147 family protein [Candidatus Diapherotrites archaeon]